MERNRAGRLHEPWLFTQRSGCGIIADKDAHLGQGGAAIFVTLPMESLLVRAKTSDPILHLGSHLTGDAWSPGRDAWSRGRDVEWDVGRRLLDDFDRFDWSDRVDRFGRVDRRCLDTRFCPAFGVQSPGAELPVVDRLNKCHRLRDQEIALFYPFHRTPHPQTLHRERCAESRVVWRFAAQPCG